MSSVARSCTRKESEASGDSRVYPPPPFPTFYADAAAEAEGPTGLVAPLLLPWRRAEGWEMERTNGRR
jgi:hypothetical protein